MSTQEALQDIRKTIVLKASIEKVWKAVATADGIASWWMPNNFAAVVGKEFILQTGQFGDSPCIVTDVEPPHRVGFDWGKDWHLEFQLKQLSDTTTEFTLIHSGWDLNTMTEFGQPHSIIRGIMNGGWEKIVNEALVNAVEQ